MGKVWNWTVPLKCYRCGRNIYMPSQTDWAYKRDRKENKNSTQHANVFFCSWRCMREHDKEFGEPRRRIYHKEEV